MCGNGSHCLVIFCELWWKNAEPQGGKKKRRKKHRLQCHTHTHTTFFLTKVSIFIVIFFKHCWDATEEAAQITTHTRLFQQKKSVHVPSTTGSSAGFEPSSFLCFIAWSSFFSCRTSFRNSSLQNERLGWVISTLHVEPQQWLSPKDGGRGNRFTGKCEEIKNRK